MASLFKIKQLYTHFSASLYPCTRVSICNIRLVATWVSSNKLTFSTNVSLTLKGYPMKTHSPQAVLHFWFQASTPAQWFNKDANYDALIRTRFTSTVEAAIQGECAHWRHSIQGRLAEIIVLDQFCRNIWRDTARAFSQDPMALALAQEAIHRSDFQRLPVAQKSFMLMPFMHSESRAIHAQALDLFKEHANESAFQYELLHKKIIDRFGRYPHRNKLLGRKTTPEERAFLQEENSSF